MPFPHVSPGPNVPTSDVEDERLSDTLCNARPLWESAPTPRFLDAALDGGETAVATAVNHQHRREPKEDGFASIVDSVVPFGSRERRVRLILDGRCWRHEQRILALLTESLGIRQIAEGMSLAEKTGKNYVSHLPFKLDMRGRTQVAAFAARLSEKLDISIGSLPTPSKGCPGRKRV
jgi:DNA-binding CsgD family transcriptional regulator